LNAEQTNFALLGALIAVALVLLAVVAVGGYMLLRGVGYFARFKGFQASRKDGSMSFGGVVDETPTPPKPPSFVPVDAPAEDNAFEALN
jgi:hypothetical protein